MGSIIVNRTQPAELRDTNWQDDVLIEWVGSECECYVCAMAAYQDADARLILRRGPHERTIGSQLGCSMMYNLKCSLADGDQVVLQWRALDASRPATSKLSELTIEGKP